ncbi:MAG: DNA-directed DNA polymerase II small subunit [Methanophagales archaeon]|nr:DNA-directed DNA polymerase II small subunit [Methanophagales archaeon]
MYGPEPEPKRGGREPEIVAGVELEIVKRFAELGYQVQPDAVDLLRRYQLEQGVGSSEIVEWVVNSLDSSSVFVISEEHIAEVIKHQTHIQTQHRVTNQERAPAPPVIIKSFASSAGSVQQGDFLQHFISRYEEIGGIIKRRMNSSRIGSVRNIRTDEDVSVVGMVTSVNKTARGNLLVDLEDPSGHIPVVLPHHNEVIPDEVIGVTGTLTRSGYLIAHRLVYPDIPLHKTAQSSLPLASSCEEPGYAVFISDMHVGSRAFREDAWDSFVDWLREAVRSRSIDIGYLIVAGDIVDGIGVYPGQESDLAIEDIEEQYKMAAQCLKRIPGSIHVVLAPGNHDAVRSAEPQPPLHGDFQRFFPPNTCFVSNPAYIKVGGRIVLIYHGQSFDDFVNAVSRLDYSKPADMMVEMLRRRHIAPIYGNSVSIIPDGHDYGVINPVPDILHCGHTHTVGIARYRDVLLINSGAWQSQTEYQKKRGINPVVGCATLVELSELKTKVLDFGKDKDKEG